MISESRTNKIMQHTAPEEHDQQESVAEESEDDEERVEEDDDDEEPGVVSEEGAEVRGAEVHRGVAVEAGEELHERLDESRVNSTNRISSVIVPAGAVVKLQHKVFNISLLSEN